MDKSTANLPVEHVITAHENNTQELIIRDPARIIQEARQIATELEKVVANSAIVATVEGKKYLMFEAWQTIAKFYGVTTKIIETNYVEYGDIAGWEAKAEAINENGVTISATESMCLNDEPTWKRKPLFQLRSMAQTRASAKVLRHAFAWVAVLAGYSPTPAEEMQDTQGKKDYGKNAEGAKTDDNGNKISEAQNKRVYAIGRKLIAAGIWKEADYFKEVSFHAGLTGILSDTRNLTTSQIKPLFTAMDKKLAEIGGA